MNKISKVMIIFIGVVLGTLGLLNLVGQYKSGEEISWTFAVVMIGFGYGLPLLFVLPDLDDHGNSSQNDVSSGSTDYDGGGDGGGAE